MTHVHIMTPRHNLYDIFQATVNKIKTNYVTADDDTLSSYRTILVNQYNDIVDHINVKQPRANAENKEIYGRNRIFCRKLLIQALDLLKCTYDIDLDLKSHIVLQDISEPNTGEIESIPNLANLFPEQVEQIQNNMTDLSAPEFLKLVSSHINKPYTGDPLSLNSFIDSIRLLETLATTAALRTLFVTAIKTKIDGDAREYITNEHTTVNGIIEALQANCTPDASKVIEGRMLSLKLKMGEQQDFAEKTEKLAESLRRSLIVEGITHAKANEMAIDKTIEVCRANAKSDLVKSVLEAAKFQKPKEVVAKLLTQVDKARHEHQVLSFQRAAARPQGHNRNNFRGRGRGYNGYRGNRGYFNGNQNFNQRNNGQNRYGQNNNNQNFRGRGGNSNYRGNRYNNNNNYRNNRNVRYFEDQGNGESPPPLRSGGGRQNQ